MQKATIIVCLQTSSCRRIQSFSPSLLGLSSAGGQTEFPSKLSNSMATVIFGQSCCANSVRLGGQSRRLLLGASLELICIIVIRWERRESTGHTQTDSWPAQQRYLAHRELGPIDSQQLSVFLSPIESNLSTCFVGSPRVEMGATSWWAAGEQDTSPLINKQTNGRTDGPSWDMFAHIAPLLRAAAATFIPISPLGYDQLGADSFFMFARETELWPRVFNSVPVGSEQAIDKKAECNLRQVRGELQQTKPPRPRYL